MKLDVAVVGAGPAGSWAAFKLAQAGARVTVFDGSHPREKPCGGGVTGRALALVAPAVPAWRLPAVQIEDAIFEDAGGAEARVPLDAGGGAPRLVVASRTDFDAALLNAALAAGATLIRDRTLEVARTSAGFMLRTRRERFVSSIVIGADGANSLVRRRMLRPFRRDQLSIATGFFARGVSSTSIVVRLMDKPPGYFWSFPRPDHLAIGLCAQATEASAEDLRAKTLAWIKRRGLAGPELKMYSWPIPTLSAADVEREPIAAGNVLLIGDAAGLVDPITREGIYFALRSAELAAATLIAGQSGHAYTGRVCAAIHGELRKAARLKAAFFRPRFIQLLMRALLQSTSIRTVMADLVAGEQPYATLERRLLRTLEMRLAWDVLRMKIART